MLAAPIRVVLADDHEMVRESLASILSETGGIEVVAQAAGVAEAVDAVERLRPDVLVLDYSLPVGDAPAAMEAAFRKQPRLRVLILTIHANIHYALRCLEAGAHGFVVKAAAVKELVEAIHAVSSGDVYISSAVSQQVLQRLRTPRESSRGIDALSPREFDVLCALGSGMGISQCARHLQISTSTASTYRARIMEKLELQSTAELIRFALENDLVG